MKRRLIDRLRKCIRNEVAIEYKACLYFFCILFFYCMYRLWQGICSASILHMGEIIFSTYFMGYFQVYGLHNFDEAETLGLREAGGIFLCTALYTALSFLCGWFGKNTAVTALFFFFMLLAYWCAYFVNKVKRSVDTENLNRMLADFKKGETRT